MDRKIALALVIAAAAGSAFADDPTPQPEPFTSVKTRAEVLAELRDARQSGIDPWADAYDPLLHMRCERTREEVTLEYLATRDRVSALNGEDSGSVYLARREGAHEPAIQLASSPEPGIEE